MVNSVDDNWIVTEYYRSFSFSLDGSMDLFSDQMMVWWSNVDHLVRRHTGVGKACWNCYNCSVLNVKYDEFYYCNVKNREMFNVLEVCDWWEFRERKE